MLASNKFIAFTLYILVIFVIVIIFLFYWTPVNLNINYTWILNPGITKEKSDKIQKYVEIHENIINGISTPRVVFNGDIRPGYANRIYGLLTSFVVAILTDSALIIEWKNIDKFIEPPLLRTYDKFNSTSLLNSEYKPSEIYNLPASTANTWVIEKHFKFYNKYSLPPNASRIRFKSNSALFFDLCTNEKYFPKIIDYDLASFWTVWKANESIYNFSMTEPERVENLLRVGFEVGTKLLRRFWKPKDYIQTLINKYLEDSFHGFFMIGMHLRYQYLNEIDVIAFADCALQLEKNINMSVKWYVASDSLKILTMLEKKFKDKIIFGTGKIGHISYYTDMYFRAILDNELLSRCDEIIITGGSSFGFSAAIKNGRLPYYIEGKVNKSECQRMVLNKPPKSFYGSALI
jgi:hypothetical protein